MSERLLPVSVRTTFRNEWTAEMVAQLRGGLAELVVGVPEGLRDVAMVAGDPDDLIEIAVTRLAVAHNGDPSGEPHDITADDPVAYAELMEALSALLREPVLGAWHSASGAWTAASDS